MPAPDPSIGADIQDGILTHAISLLRVAAGERQKVLSLLEALEVKLIADLGHQVGKTPNAIAKLQALLKQTQQTISQAYAEVAKANGKTLEKIAAIEATKTVNVTNAALKVSVATVGLSASQLQAIAGKTLVQGKYPKEWWAQQSQQLQDKFATQMREGMLKGEGIDELTRRVRGTKAKAYTDGLMQSTKAQAEALVRTSVMSVANEARIATILGNTKINKAIQWVATLDSRTTLICKALDGLRWTVPDLKPVGHDKVFPGPIAHWQCRSTQVPVTYSWAELAGAKSKLKTTDGVEGNYPEVLAQTLEDKGMSPAAAAAAAATQKAKMTDKSGASGTLTFEDWLQGKTPEQVDELLGPGRAKLWQEGKVTLAQMTDQNNRPLTLEELHKQVGEPPKHYDATYPTPQKPPPFHDQEAEAKAAAAKKAAAALAAEQQAAATIEASYEKFDAESVAILELNELNMERGGKLTSLEIVQQAKAKVAAELAAKEATAQKEAAQRKTWEAEKAKAAAEVEIEAQKAAAAADAQQARAAAVKAMEEADLAEVAAKKAALELKQKNDAAQAEIAAVMTDSTGKKLLAKNLGKLMKDQPELDPHELLSQAKVQALADQAKASTAAALSGYKQKFLAGQEPTPAQKKALQGLPLADQVKFKDQLQAAHVAVQEAAAAKAAQEAAAVAAQQAQSAQAVAQSKPATSSPVPPSSIPVPAGFPDEPTGLKLVKKLGGTTGAELVKDADGNLYVRKRGATPEHLREEVATDALYQAMGVNVPAMRLYETPTGPVKLSRFIEGQSLQDYLASATPDRRGAVTRALQEDFARDALLGNWDVLGTSMDNVLVDTQGVPWRIDNGGGLRFRAMGSPKVGNQWDDHPTELWTMRGKQLAAGDTGTLPGNVQVFGNLEIYDLARQAIAIDRAALAAAPPEVRATLERRLENMQAIAQKALAYQGDGLRWKAGSVDEITRHMMGLREAGLVAAMPTRMTNQGTIVSDQDGLPWDHLRTKGSGGQASMPPPAVAPGDQYWPTVKAALATFGFNASKAQPLNEAKVKAAMDLLPALKQQAAKGNLIAAHYVDPLEKLGKAVEQYKASGNQLYNAQPLLDPYKAPAPAAGTPAPVKPAERKQSLIADLAAYIKAQGGNFAAISDWQGMQAGSSWSESAVAVKFWHYLNQDGNEKPFWGLGKVKGAEAEWNRFAARHGGAEATQRTLRAYMAFVQEFLSNTDFKFNDRGRQAVRLVRTEIKEVITNNGLKVGQYGNHTLVAKGLNESHSIYTSVKVAGTEPTAMAVPYTRITGLYWFERAPGAGYGAFAGEGENEFTANTNGLPVSYVARAQVMDVQAGGDNDALKWNVPLTHLK